ncbi:ROK family protein [Acidobacteriota bacterium]
MKEYIVGVDLGGTKIEACLLDGQRNCLDRRRVFSEAAMGMDHVIDKIIRLIKTVSGEKTYSAVGIGTPGTFVEVEERIYGSPHTPVYHTTGFIPSLKKKLSPCPVVVDNDANCLAVAEYFSGCKGKYSSVMAVILGTGVGSGLVLNDKLYQGSRGGGGEIGHMTIDFNGRICECGRRGCVEAYLSGPSHSRRFFDLSGQKLQVQDIYKLYQDQDPFAVELFAESTNILAETFANIVNVLDIDAIILGGGVSNLPIWYDKVPQLMANLLFGVPRDNIPILKANLGDSAGVFGAAYLALRELKLMEF